MDVLVIYQNEHRKDSPNILVIILLAGWNVSSFCKLTLVTRYTMTNTVTIITTASIKKKHNVKYKK